MARIKRTRPSPAILISVIALVAALGGSAVAEVATTSKLNKKEKKEVGKIAKKKANKQIEKKAPGLDVNSAKTADSTSLHPPSIDWTRTSRGWLPSAGQNWRFRV